MKQSQSYGNYNQYQAYCVVILSRNKNNLIIGTACLKIERWKRYFAVIKLSQERKSVSVYRARLAIDIGIGSLKDWLKIFQFSRRRDLARACSFLSLLWKALQRVSANLCCLLRCFTINKRKKYKIWLHRSRSSLKPRPTSIYRASREEFLN